MQSLFKSVSSEEMSTCKAFTQAVTRAAAKYKNLVLLDANSSKFFNFSNIASGFQDRRFNFGNAEENMIGAACGMTVRGKIPMVCTFSMFLTGRAFEQIRNGICYPNLNIKIIGLDAGIFNGQDGATYQALEDVAIMRTLPNMKVLCPADAVETKKMVEEMLNDYSPTYLRISSAFVPALYNEDYDFKIGKANIYKSGTDVCIFALGHTVHTSLEAAKLLEKEGISTMIVNVSTLNPIDEGLITECAKQASHIVTVEDHQIVGGLGSAVMEVLSSSYPCKVLRIGMNSFGESGKLLDLYRKFGLSPERIAEQVRKLV